MADGVPVSRCGPLCQHPGCWHTTTHAGHGQHKDTEYTRFLSELLLRKKELKRLQTREGAGLHSTRTSDGLPTLKVQSINQKLLEGRGSAQRRRSKTLPPLKISTRKCAGSVIQKYRESPSKASTVNYVQMQLQVDQEALDSDLCSELVFSPVLLWRPGRAQRHPPPSAPAHETTKVSNEKTKRPNQSSTTTHPTSSTPPHPLPRPQHTPPPATHVATHKDRSVWRIQAENLSTGRKGPLLIKTTDLTNALPPQTSFESPLHNENKDITSAAKHGKARQKLTTADAECFSYLGDIPPQVVAEILHQLRSESSSSIDGTTTRPPHSTAHHMIHTMEKSQKAYQSTTTQPRVPIPMASLPHSTYLPTSSNTAHVPASLAYELSTHKLLKPEPVRPKRRVSSFSRELSKRPLEVLRRRSGRPNATGEEEVLERITIPKIISNEEIKESFAMESEWPVLKQSAKRHSHQMHLPTAEIEPPTDLPAAGVRPHYQPSLAADLMQGNPPTHHQHTVETKSAQVRFHSPPTSAVHNHITDDHHDFVGPPTVTTEDGGGAQPRVPSTILLQLNADTAEQCELHPLSGFDSKRSRVGGHNIMVHSPRHRVLAPNSTVVCPFSEEASPNHELETRGLLLKRRLQSRERKSRESRREQSAVSAEHEHPPPLPSSVSPDYMLVGAHFADNNLVLVDKDGKIVHQLTDTEGESDANIIAHLSELNIHTQLSVEPHVVPRMESLTSEEGPSTAEVSKPGTGMQAPPPTALEHGPDSVEGEEEADNNIQVLIQVPKVEEIPQTEADLGEIRQETETEKQPNINRDDNETKERGSQDEGHVQETLETVENNEAERRDYREVQEELKSEDEREQTPHDTVPTAEQKEDKIPESKSVEEFEGAAEVPEGESEMSRPDIELQGRTPPEEHSKSEDENEPARIDSSVEEVPVPITEQCDYEDSEENSA